MRVLALETSTRNASLALAERDQLIRVEEMPRSARTAVWLAEAVQRAVHDANWEPQTIELVSVTRGPGSFTGLRIGVTTAKMLAFAWQTPIVALDTLSVIARQVDHAGPVRVAMDAQRNELFTATFERIEVRAAQVTRDWIATVDTRVISTEEWLAEEDHALLTGPALEQLADRIPEGCAVADRSVWYPSAATLAKAAPAELAAGRQVEPTELTVHYHRQSYAERN